MNIEKAELRADLFFELGKLVSSDRIKFNTDLTAMYGQDIMVVKEIKEIVDKVRELK